MYLQKSILEYHGSNETEIDEIQADIYNWLPVTFRI